MHTLYTVRGNVYLRMPCSCGPINTEYDFAAQLVGTEEKIHTNVSIKVFINGRQEKRYRKTVAIVAETEIKKALASSRVKKGEKLRKETKFFFKN